mgnify:FL=1|jgi:hypothetical protein
MSQRGEMLRYVWGHQERTVYLVLVSGKAGPSMTLSTQLGVVSSTLPGVLHIVFEEIPLPPLPFLPCHVGRVANYAMNI